MYAWLQTQDTNSFFIAKLMFRRGIDVKRVVVIPDELDASVTLPHKRS